MNVSGEDESLEGPVEGALFVRNYVRPAIKQSDGLKARRRMAYLVEETFGRSSGDFVKQVQRQLGVHYPGSYTFAHMTFFESCALEEFLSTITILINCSSSRNSTLAKCSSILLEEHLRYRIDSKGGVHYFVDETFEHNIGHTIEGLGGQRFGAARQALEETLSKLAVANPSGKALIRGVFESIETVFLTLLNIENVNRLNAQAIDSYLKSILLARYSKLGDAEDRVDRLLSILKAWVHAAHPFRHGANVEELHEAPMDYAILMTDQGMAHIRFIASLA